MTQRIGITGKLHLVVPNSLLIHAKENIVKENHLGIGYKHRLNASYWTMLLDMWTYALPYFKNELCLNEPDIKCQIQPHSSLNLLRNLKSDLNQNLVNGFSLYNKKIKLRRSIGRVLCGNKYHLHPLFHPSAFQNLKLIFYSKVTGGDNVQIFVTFLLMS